jgi:hypothetical protein
VEKIRKEHKLIYAYLHTLPESHLDDILKHTISFIYVSKGSKIGYVRKEADQWAMYSRGRKNIYRITITENQLLTAQILATAAQELEKKSKRYKYHEHNIPEAF